MNYEIVGEGTPLLFMHGLSANRKQTLSALSSLKDTQLIAPDFRGHGDSPMGDSPLNFNQFADDAIELLDHLGHDKINIGGLSMGSGVSLNLALRYPERVNKLILLRPSWSDQKKPEHLKLVAFAGQYIEEVGLEDAEVKLESHPDFEALFKENAQVAKSILAIFTRPQAVEAAAVLYKMWEDRPFDSLNLLANISNPALILYTTHDMLHPTAVARTIAEKLTHSSIAELPPRYYEVQAYTNALIQEIEQFLNR